MQMNVRSMKFDTVGTGLLIEKRKEKEKKKKDRYLAQLGQ